MECNGQECIAQKIYNDNKKKIIVDKKEKQLPKQW